MSVCSIRPFNRKVVVALQALVLLALGLLLSGCEGSCWLDYSTFQWVCPASSTSIFSLIFPSSVNSPTASITEFPVPSAGSHPDALVAGPDGKLWFTEYSANKIGTISASGVITEYTGLSAGAQPFGITLGPDNNLWFAEQEGNRIGKMTPDGTGIVEYPILTPGSKPYQITTGPDGNLWFTEFVGNKIGKISTSGVITEYTLPTSNSRPFGITAGPDGNVWFTEQTANKIGKITPAGAITEYNTGLTANSKPALIVKGLDDNLWFTEFAGNKIGMITVAGVITEYAVPTPNSGPSGIVAGLNGTLWFTEYTANKIGQITLGGTVISETLVTTANSGPNSIVLGPDYNIWFSQYSGNKIARLSDVSLADRLWNEIVAPTASGQRYRDLYDTHGVEIFTAMITHPDLMAGAYDIVQTWSPLVATLFNGQSSSTTITQADMDTLTQFFDDLAAAGSPGLQQAINQEKARTPPSSFVGKTVAQARLMAAGYTVFLPLVVK